MLQPTLVVLAAGIGSRYGGLKQIESIGSGGETIIDYSIYDAIRAGFGKVVFVIRRQIEADFKQAISARFTGRIPVEHVFQELDNLPAGFKVPAGREKPWGTGHAILGAADAVREPFAAINADDFYGAESFRILAAHLRSGSADFAMVGFTLRNTLSEFGTVARGLCTLSPSGLLETVTELTRIEPVGNGARNTDASGKIQPLTGDEIVSMNMWGFTPALFDHLRAQFQTFLEAHGREAKSEFYIPTVVNSLIRDGAARLKVLRSPDSWFGVTYREDRPRVMVGVRELVERGIYPARLWS